MYKIIKDNIFNPKKLADRKHSSNWSAFFLLVFLVILISVTPIINFITYDPLSPTAINNLKTNYSESFQNIDCQIDNTLVCSKPLHKVQIDYMYIVFNPTDDYTPESLGWHFVLGQNKARLYVANNIIMESSYDGSSGFMWANAWKDIKIDADSDQFWNQFSYGLVELVERNSMVFYFLGITYIILLQGTFLLFELMVFTLLLRLFGYGSRVGEVFKIVLNASTLYVIIIVMLGLYALPVSILVWYMLKLIPIIYTIIAIRNYKGET